MRKECPYSELFWSSFFPHFPAFGLPTERYLGKNADQNNSEYEKLLRSVFLRNVYHINIVQTLKFMHKTKNRINPRVSLQKFRSVDHHYSIRFCQHSFYYKKSACKTTSFAITVRCSYIWNSFSSQHEEFISHLLSFLKQIKFKEEMLHILTIAIRQIIHAFALAI